MLCSAYGKNKFVRCEQCGSSIVLKCIGTSSSPQEGWNFFLCLRVKGTYAWLKTNWSAKSSHVLLDHHKADQTKWCYTYRPAWPLVHNSTQASSIERTFPPPISLPLFLLSASSMQQYAERGRHRERPRFPADEVG